MRKALTIAAVNVLLIVVVLVVAEAVFGTWISGPDYSFLNLRRNTVRHFDVSNLYDRGGLVTYSRDEHGLRGDYGTPGDIDVLVMGGSTTDEPYVSDGETWVDQLAAAFARAGRPLRFANAAVDGQSSLGHLRAIELWFPNIPDLEPRYVIVYVGINDQAVPEDGDMSRYDEMLSPDPLRRLRHYVMNHSVLYNRFRQLRGMFAAQRTKLIHGADAVRGAVWRPVTEIPDETALAATWKARLDAYGKRLRQLARRIREDMGAVPIYVTQKRGDFRRVEGRLMVRMVDAAANRSAKSHMTLDLFNRRTLAVCAEIRIACVDLAGELTFEDGDFYDALHTTPAGSKRIGEFLYERLKDVIL